MIIIIIFINCNWVVTRWQLSEHKHCDIVATNANNEKAKSRMEASSAGKCEYGDKGR
jgi:hypothetical protein